MKVNLSDEAKAEFIEHIAKQSINCWFEGDEFVMPSGQGKASKGIVLYQLQVWELKQKKIDDLKEKIAQLQKKIDAVDHVLGCAMIAPKEVFSYADRIRKALDSGSVDDKHLTC